MTTFFLDLVSPPPIDRFELPSDLEEWLDYNPTAELAAITPMVVRHGGSAYPVGASYLALQIEDATMAVDFRLRFDHLIAGVSGGRE